MAFTLGMDYEIVSVGTGIIVTDTTNYGGDNPDRVDCTVNFEITDKRTGEAIVVTYDETTVDEILIPVTHDGWHSIKMTVSYEAETTVTDEKYLDILVTERFCDCMAEYTNKLTEKPCGCEDSKVWEKLFCLKGQLIGVETLVSKNDMLSADMAIERLGLECARLNSDCGC